MSSIHEINEKEHFALELPPPSDSHIASLPALDSLLPLFERPMDRPAPEERVSLLLPFFAQHLTDAVFQSKNQFQTDAPHEIVLNQIYGNTYETTRCLRSFESGRLKSHLVTQAGGESEFPPLLLEQDSGGQWRIKKEFASIDYLDAERAAKLMEAYKGREREVCAVGLLQGNLTIGNFALTTLFLREHNRLCGEIADERKKKGEPTDDELVFNQAAAVNILQYMRIVVEDYVNGFAGLPIFRLDTQSFFYESRPWCRASPMPFHFNILYRLHSMIPNSFELLHDEGFAGFLANNSQVMRHGLGEVLQRASAQPSSVVDLRNTHPELLPVEMAMLSKGRAKLAPYADYRRHERLSNTDGFGVFAAEHREALRKLYGGDFGKVDYAVGIFAESPNSSILERMGVKKRGFLGETMLRSIAKHAFRHVLSSPLMRREFLNPAVLGDAGWNSLATTHTLKDLVQRNTPELGAKSAALEISMDAPKFR